jgi:hypothetical protein
MIRRLRSGIDVPPRNFYSSTWVFFRYESAHCVPKRKFSSCLPICQAGEIVQDRMAERTFTILRYIDKVPATAACLKCKLKFFTPHTYPNDPFGASVNGGDRKALCGLGARATGKIGRCRRWCLGKYGATGLVLGCAYHARSSLDPRIRISRKTCEVNECRNILIDDGFAMLRHDFWLLPLFQPSVSLLLPPFQHHDFLP